MVARLATWYSSRTAGNQNTNSNFVARGDGRTEVTESSAQHRFFPRRSSVDDQRREQERAWRVILEPWRKKRLERAKRRRRARLSRVCFHTRYHAYAKAAGSVPIVSEELLVLEGGWNSSSRCNSNDAESGTTIGFFRTRCRPPRAQCKLVRTQCRPPRTQWTLIRAQRRHPRTQCRLLRTQCRQLHARDQ